MEGLKGWVVEKVMGYVIRQLSKKAEGLPWENFRAEAEKFLRDLVPGDLFDAAVVSISDGVLALVEKCLGDEVALEKVAKLALDQKFEEAGEALKQLVIKHWDPIEFPELQAAVLAYQPKA